MSTYKQAYIQSEFMTDQCEQDIWDTYIQSYIVDAKSHDIIWAGPNAGPLSLATPIHVITACNSFEQKMSAEENRQRNNLLLKQLKTLQVKIKPVIGRSPGGDWQEPSFAIYGLSRKEACELASEFEQRGIFELTNEEVFVIEVNSQNPMRQKARIAS